MDLEPRNADTMALRGPRLDQHPAIGPMLARAMAEGKPVASDPMPLLRPNGPVGLVLAAPVMQEGAASPAGFVTFSYELAPLMLTNDDLLAVLGGAEGPARRQRRAGRQRPGRRHARGRSSRGPAAVGDANGDVRRSRLVARLLRQDQCGEARAADGRHRGGHRASR